MRVCLLNDSFPPVIDGVANTVMNYARILTESGMAEALVGTPRYPDADYASYPYRVVPYQSFDTTGIAMGYRAGNPLAMGAVREMAEFAPDLIHTHCPVSSTIMARILRNETDAPIVLTYHTKYDVDLARAVKAEFLRASGIRTMLNNIEACDEVWTVSEGAGESLKALGFQGEYRVMSNGVDFQKGRVAEDKVREAVKGYDLPEGIPVFLFVGRIMKYKGLPLILDGLARYAESGADFRMVFVGGGADRDTLIDEAKAAGFAVDVTDENGHTESGGSGALSGRCIFTGPVYDRDVLRAWNTRADLFLFPSTYDTNGIVVREAAACGLASVLIKGSCAAEGITDHRNGYLIEESGEALAELLKETGSDLDAMHTTGQHAMDEIYISWEDSVHAAYERYQAVLERKAQGKLAARRHVKTEFFLNMAAEFAEDTEELFRMPKYLYDDMRENTGEFMDEARANMEHFRQKLRESRDEIRTHAKDEWNEFVSDVKGLKKTVTHTREEKDT